MKHYRDVRLNSSSTHGIGVDGNTSLCGKAWIFRTIKDIKVQIMHEVPFAINCQACRKSIELITRHQLRLLKTSELEDVLEYIGQVRSNGG